MEEEILDPIASDTMSLPIQLSSSTVLPPVVDSIPILSNTITPKRVNKQTVDILKEFENIMQTNSKLTSQHLTNSVLKMVQSNQAKKSTSKNTRLTSNYILTENEAIEEMKAKADEINNKAEAIKSNKENRLKKKEDKENVLKQNRIEKAAKRRERELEIINKKNNKSKKKLFDANTATNSIQFGNRSPDHLDTAHGIELAINFETGLISRSCENCLCSFDKESTEKQIKWMSCQECDSWFCSCCIFTEMLNFVTTDDFICNNCK